MRILYIVPYVPNLIRVRPYQLIRALCRRGHDVTLATLWSSGEEQSDLRDIGGYCAQVIAYPLARRQVAANLAQNLLASTPFQSVYCWQPQFAAALAAALRSGSYDAVHVEHLRAARYGLYVQAVPDAASMPVVWDSVDCISSLFQQASQQSRSLKTRWMTALDLKRTRRYEGQLVHRFDRVLVTSSLDRQALREAAHGQAARAETAALADDARIQVIRNGVDLDYFTPNYAGRAKSSIVFSGKMSYHANVTAALHLANEIMPLVWATHPNTRLYIVGKDPAPAVRALAAPKTGDRRIVVTGTVPDIRPFLQRAALAAAPVPYGAGIQNKVLEAMACGAPVVASPQAVSALDCQPGRDVWVAQDAPSFARQIATLLDRPETAVQLGRSGRDYAERCHSWSSAAAELEQIYAAAREAHRSEAHRTERQHTEQGSPVYASSY
jgi:sugar transferase (PEP-CTERM/EpsH1 system associated)